MIVECSGCQLRYDSSGKKPGSQIRCRCGKPLTIPFFSATAVGLHCPNCASPASPHKNTCDSCESQLAVLNCPSCFTLQFSGSRHCSNCGDKLMLPSRAVKSEEHSCPRCEGVLAKQSVNGVFIEQCAPCGGVWLDHDVLESIVKNARQSQDAVAFTGNKAVPPIRVNTHEVMYLSCPECDMLMHRRNFGLASGVIIDVCSAHGLWFDANELAAALVFVRSGGEQRSLKRGASVDTSTSRVNKEPWVGTLTSYQASSRDEFGWREMFSALATLFPFR